MRRLAVAAVVAIALAGCTPWQLAQVQQAQAEMTCHQAVDLLWPAASRAWAHRIVQRESGGDRFAANPTSSARGCGQLLMSLHGWRFTAVGCTPAQWMVAVCNVRAMLHLYRQAGTRPWAL